MSEIVHWDPDDNETAACGKNGKWSSTNPADVTCRKCGNLAAEAMMNPLFA